MNESANTGSFIDRSMILLGLSAFVLGVLAFWGGLDNLVFRWIQREEYSHGFFIPVIAAWLLWERREALAASVGSPSWAGVAMLAVALGLLLLGELSAIFLLIHLGFLLLLPGLVLAFGGYSLLRLTLLPLALLVFAVPMPYFIDAQLSWGLQLLSSRWGVELLRWLDVSVYLQGNVIDLGSYQMQVVEACSGLRYLYPLLSLGFLAAYLFQAPLWQRALLFLSTIPITVFMNSFRIATIGVLVERWGPGQAEGFLHFFEGWVIFMACTLLLLAEMWLFVRLSGGCSVRDRVYLAQVHAVDPVTRKPDPWPLSATILLLLLAVTTVMTISGREEALPERRQLTLFPLELGQWRARESHLEAIVERKLELDDYLLADYGNGQGETVNFYVAYYASQRKGVSPHSPRVCIPGGGWLITDHTRPLLRGVNGQSFPVNRTLIERDDQRQLVYYWFQQRGRYMASEYRMKWYLLLDALLRNRSDGALVRVTTPLSANETVETADGRIRAFIQQALPILPAFVPE